MEIVNLAKSGSPPPPIMVQAGKSGTPIKDVVLDIVGDK